VQSSEVVGVIVLERCLVQLDDDADQSLCSFVIGELIEYSYMCRWMHDEQAVAVQKCGPERKKEKQ